MFRKIINVMHIQNLPFTKWLLSAVVISCLLAACQKKNSKEFTSWQLYRGDEGGNAYSQLNQINRGNVKQLKIAWIYHSGNKAPDYSSLETSPIIIHDVLYGISPDLKTFALDAKTGKELWNFDPFANSKGGGVCRGLTFWESGDDQRIFMFASNKLIALDAKTGKQIMNFGDSGFTDLNKGLRANGGIEHHEDVGNTSPGVIYKNLIITGSAVSEDYESSPGHIRAYDVSTGKMKWIFHTIPEPGEFGYNTWQKDSYKTVGGCNAWSGLSIDSKR